MSKRVESRSFGLPHLGQSLGEVRLCVKFPTTSRKFCSIPTGFVAPIVLSLLLASIVLLCCLLGNLMNPPRSQLRGLCDRLEE